jgi:hypothetical protein
LTLCRYRYSEAAGGFDIVIADSVDDTVTLPPQAAATATAAGPLKPGLTAALGISQTMQVLASVADAAGVQLAASHSNPLELTEHMFASFEAFFVRLFGSIASDLGVGEALVARLLLVGCFKNGMLFQDRVFFENHSSTFFLRTKLEAICRVYLYCGAQLVERRHNEHGQPCHGVGGGSRV